MSIDRPPFLWLPHHLVQQANGTEEYQRFPLRALITAGGQDLFDYSPTLPEIISLLSSYSLGEVLELCGRVSAVLFNSDTKNQLETQRALIHAFFGADTNVESRFKEVLEKHDAEGAFGTVIFHHLQLLVAAKIAFLTLPPTLVQRENLDPKPLGSALLLINDFIPLASGEFSALADPGPKGRRERVMYMLANGLFYQPHDRMQDFVRAHDLLLGQSKRNPEWSEFVAKRIRRSTHLEPELFWLAQIGMHAHMSAITRETASEKHAGINRATYFSDTLTFTTEESRRMVDLVAIPAERMSEEVRGRYTLKDLRPYDVLPFARNPLVSFGDQAICLSLHLLGSRITFGIYHQNLVEDSFSREERAKYQVGLGDRFGEYVGDLLSEQSDPARTRLILDDELRGLMGDKKARADAICLFPDGAVIVEAKASPFPAAVRTGFDYDGLVRKVDAVFVRGMEQARSTVDWIRTEAGPDLGLRNASSVFFPVIVTLDDLPMNPWLYELIEERLRHHGLLLPFPGGPLQAFDINDFEMLPEVLRVSGKSLREILAMKAGDGKARGLSLKNWLFDYHPDWQRAMEPQNTTALRFKELSEEALATMRGFSRAPDSFTQNAEP